MSRNTAHPLSRSAQPGHFCGLPYLKAGLPQCCSGWSCSPNSNGEHNCRCLLVKLFAPSPLHSCGSARPPRTKRTKGRQAGGRCRSIRPEYGVGATCQPPMQPYRSPQDPLGPHPPCLVTGVMRYCGCTDLLELHGSFLFVPDGCLLCSPAVRMEDMFLTSSGLLLGTSSFLTGALHAPPVGLLHTPTSLGSCRRKGEHFVWGTSLPVSHQGLVICLPTSSPRPARGQLLRNLLPQTKAIRANPSQSNTNLDKTAYVLAYATAVAVPEDTTQLFVSYRPYEIRCRNLFWTLTTGTPPLNWIHTRPGHSRPRESGSL